MFALAAKCTVMVKDRSDALVSAVFASLVEEGPSSRPRRQPKAGPAATIRAKSRCWAPPTSWWPSAATRRCARSVRTCGADARFVGFGHRASIGYIDAERSPRVRAKRLLEGIAADALLYDGDGCLSLHALFVGGEAAASAALAVELAAAFERESVEFPAGSSDPQRAARQARTATWARFAQPADTARVYAPAHESTTIAFDPPRDEPPPFLPRVMPVFPVREPAEAVEYIHRHRLPVEALGVSDPTHPKR